MKYICKFCKKNLNSKQNLDYHYINNVCVDKSKVFCKICVKYYKNKYTYKRHCKTKHKELFINDKSFSSDEYKCNNCEKVFSRKYNLKVHLNNNVCCDKSKNITINNSNSNNVNNITNNTNIIHNTNNIINISLNGFGDEDIASITNEELLKIVKRCYNSVSELFKRIHIDIPENRNLYLSNHKEGNISVYKNGKWDIHDAKKILKKIQDINIDIIGSFYKNNIDNFNNNKSIEKMFDDFNNNKLTSKYNKDIKLLLENHKDIIRKTKDNDVMLYME